VIRVLAGLCVRAYYSACRVENADRIPRTGPVLFVGNHPNAIMDAAIILCAIPRPVSFAAKNTLFSVPLLGWVLRKLGAVPVYRPRDRTGSSRENLKIFAAFTEHFRGGGAAAIFPEGHSHLDPELKEVKSGPARIALDAEGDADFGLGLSVVAVGLHYEPRQQFRGEVHVRIGEPFGVEDLKDKPRREAIRIVTGRIADALRPLVLHLDRTDLEPLVREVAEVYDEHQRMNTGGVVPRPRGEVVKLAGACLNHFLVTDPKAVTITQRKLRRYRRLARMTGLRGRAIEHRTRPWRARLRLLWLSVRLAIGLPVYFFGLLTSYVPYRATGRLAEHYAKSQGRVSLPTMRVATGAVVFAVFWGTLTLCVFLWSRSPAISAAFFVGVVAAGFFTRYYAVRLLRWRAELEGLLALTRPGARRVARAREDLLEFVDELVRRFRADTGFSLLPPRRRPFLRRVPWRRIGVVLLIGLLGWFAWGFRDRGVAELPDRASPWAALDADTARSTLRSDARSLLSVLESLERLEAHMDALRREFGAGDRRFTDVADDREIRRALLTYLNCRGALFRLAWYYRNPDREGEPELGDAAFVVSYAAALELVRRGMQLIEGFKGKPRTIRKLNEGDSSWGLPPDTYDRVRRNLADTGIYDELAEATARFRGIPDPADARFRPVWDAARERMGAVAELAAERFAYKWEAAVARAEGAMEDGRYAAATFFADLIGHVRVRGGDLSRGLISDEQVRWLRREMLQPGDILLERRNWALSNVFLPGYWTHAALYVGGPEGIRDLGLHLDDRVRPHLGALARPDDEGRPLVVLEALGPGVVLNPLEVSVGGADGVCVLRPALKKPEIAEALARAFAHIGKPYDFDFDFFSTDRLVCTELIHQAYDEQLEFELVEVMGRETLPAIDILRKWATEREDGRARLEFVCFLDAYEDDRCARVCTCEELIATLDRPGLDLAQTHAGTSREPRWLLLVLAGLLMFGVVFLRRK